jgi:hypothetical protein
MVTLRRRWPDPETGRIIDTSEPLGPGGSGSPGRTSLTGVGVGHMDEQPNKKNLEGIDRWRQGGKAKWNGRIR